MAQQLERLGFTVFRNRPLGNGKLNRFYAVLEVRMGICTFAIDERGFIWWRRGEEHLHTIGYINASRLAQTFFAQNQWAKVIN